MFSIKKIAIATLIFVSTISLTSCNKKCKCDSSNQWNAVRLYSPQEISLHNGICWTCVKENRGVEPGPWLQNGNDSWQECTK